MMSLVKRLQGLSKVLLPSAMATIIAVATVVSLTTESPAVATLSGWSTATGTTSAVSGQAPVPTSALTSNEDDNLAATSCAAGPTCAAVGTYVDSNNVTHPLIDTLFHGIWSTTGSDAQSDPLLPADAVTDAIASSGDSFVATLDAVDCASSTFCVAVGDYVTAASAANRNFTFPLIDVTTDGVNWAPVTEGSALVPAYGADTTDDLPYGYDELTSVSC